MSLLQKVQKLSGDCHRQLIQFYESPDHRFPIEVRNLFPQEIEEAVCGGIANGVEGGLNPCDPNHLFQITDFLSNLVIGIENRIASNGTEIPFFTQHKLFEAAKDFQDRMSTNALDLFQTIRDCIDFEIKLVRTSNSESVEIQQPRDQIMEDVQIIRGRIVTTADILSRIVTEQEAFEINCNEKQTMDDCLVRLQVPQAQNGRSPDFEKQVKDKITIVEGKLQENIKNLLVLSANFEQSVESVVQELLKLHYSVQNKIQLWKYKKQLQANGSTQKSNEFPLSKLQQWCEELADLIWSTRQHLKEAERLQAHNPVLFTTTNPESASKLSGFVANVTNLLSELLSSSFLVENQPPQVMKLGTRFPSAVTLSLLVGNRLNVQMTSPAVSTCIISEAQARSLYKDPTNMKVVLSGDIANGNSKLEFNRDAKRLMANFRSMQLKRIKRADKKGGVASESVMEEKFSLLFESVVTVGDISLRIWTLSMPVVVISHGSQEAQAVATITWDNAFGEMGRIPFQVPQRVPWEELAKVLSIKFESLTGRGLSEDHLRCLKQKAFRYGSHSEFITWSEFCKDNLPDRHFSFWDWVYNAMKNIERKDTHLKEMWKENLIVGFIERQTAENLLRCMQPGTFLLRFADSQLGAITIAWVHDDGNVHLVNPFQLHDLTKCKLADAIKGLEKDMKFLYPDIPRDQAFGKHYSPPPTETSPYVKTKITLEVPSTSCRIDCGTPNRTRSNSWTPVEPTYVSELPSSHYMMDTSSGEASSSGSHSPMPEESSHMLPNFELLHSTFMMNHRTEKGTGIANKNSNTQEEAMQTQTEEEFSDLLTVIHSDLSNFTQL